MEPEDDFLPSPALQHAITTNGDPAKVEFAFEMRPRPGSGKVQLRAKTIKRQSAKGIERVRPRKQTPAERREAKARLIHASAVAAHNIADEHSNRRVFRAWLDTLTPAQRAQADALGVGAYLSDYTPPPRPAGDEDAADSAEREPIPEALARGTHNRTHTVVATVHEQLDALEPPDFSVDLAHLSPGEVAAATDDFGDALQWCFASQECHRAAHPLVALGSRAAILIAALAPDLAGGLPVDPKLGHTFLAHMGPGRYRQTLERLRHTGDIYRRVLAWMSEAGDLSGLGENLQIVAYQLRPELVDTATMEDIGRHKNKTRQAINKVVQSLRDTFDGIRAFIARPDSTRLKCQASARLAAA